MTISFRCSVCGRRWEPEMGWKALPPDADITCPECGRHGALQGCGIVVGWGR